MQKVNSTAPQIYVQNKTVIRAAQELAATAWNSRIESAVQSFKKWELASNLLRLAYTTDRVVH